MRILKYVDKKLLLILASFYLVFNIVYVLKIGFFKEVLKERLTTIPWSVILVDYILFDWILVMIFMLGIAVSTKKLLLHNVPWRRIFFLHLVFSIVIGIFIRFFGELYEILIGNKQLSDFNFQDTFRQFMNVIDLNFLIYFAMTAIIYSYYYLINLQDSLVKQEVLENQLLNSKIRMLLTQLQPHFLFNTLNTIFTLIDLEPGKAKNTLVDLSDLLRDVIEKDQNEVTLKEEIAFTNKYIRLLKTRFSDHLDFKCSIEKSSLEILVPSMILQPIIENAIEHGYSKNHSNLKIELNVFKKGGFLKIEIKNNGKRLKRNFTDQIQKGMGISNTQSRLKQLYDGKGDFHIRNLADYSGVIAIISIPIRKKDFLQWDREINPEVGSLSKKDKPIVRKL